MSGKAVGAGGEAHAHWGGMDGGEMAAWTAAAVTAASGDDPFGAGGPAATIATLARSAGYADADSHLSRRRDGEAAHEAAVDEIYENRTDGDCASAVGRSAAAIRSDAGGDPARESLATALEMAALDAYQEGRAMREGAPNARLGSGPVGEAAGFGAPRR